VTAAGMRNKTLYLTHPQFDFSVVNTKSKLLTNITQSLDDCEYHTSLGDVSSQDIINIATQFSNITFVPDKFDPNEPIYHETVVLGNYLSNITQVHGLNVALPKTFTDKIPQRPQSPTLWVFGCSHSHGVGLQSRDQIYSNIIAKELKLPLMSVTKPGSSLHWSLRQLMSANIESNDTVIWQLTTPGRLSRFNGNAIEEVLLARTTDRHLLEVNNENQIYFDQLTLLMFGVKYLRALNVRLVITSLDNVNETKYRKEYTQYPEYCYAPGFNVDLGDDNFHYGPLSHKNLATCILNHLKCNNVYTI
jgi:hypothetical protein